LGPLIHLPLKLCVSAIIILLCTEIRAQGELAHRALKAFYPLTNKLDTPAQLAKHERRRRVLRRVAEASGVSASISQSPVDPTSLDKHHYIACSRNNPVHQENLPKTN
jgi:hypothetical protein